MQQKWHSAPEQGAPCVAAAKSFTATTWGLDSPDAAAAQCVAATQGKRSGMQMHQAAMSQPEASLPCPAPAVGSAAPAPTSSDALLLNADIVTGEPSDPSLSVSEGARL